MNEKIFEYSSDTEIFIEIMISEWHDPKNACMFLFEHAKLQIRKGRVQKYYINSKMKSNDYISVNGPYFAKNYSHQDYM